MNALIEKNFFRFGLWGSLFLLALVAAVYSGQIYWIAIPFIFLLAIAGWQYPINTFYLLLFMLPFSAEYNFSSNLGTDIPDEMLMIYISALLLFHWTYSPALISKRTLRHPLLILLLIILCWGFISVVFSTDFIISAKYFLAKCWYILAFVFAPLALLKNKRQTRNAIVALASAMLIVVVITLLRHARYGFHFAYINEALGPFFRNHVVYSAMLVCIIPVFFAFYRLSDSQKIRRLLGIAIIILLAALFFSYARGAWIALIAGLAAYWLIKKRLLLISFVAAIIITLAALFMVSQNDRYLGYTRDFNTTIFHKDFREHLIATYKLKDVSAAERIYRWVAGLRMIKDNPLTGYGPNTFYENYKQFTIPAFRTWVSGNEDHSTVHNYFLLTAIEQGIPGLIFFLVLFGGMLYYAQYLYHRVKDPFYKTIAIATGVMLVMIAVVNFLSDLIETDKIGSLFFLCIGMLILADLNSREIITNSE